MDTIRIRRDPDWFPLLEGLRLTYHHTSTEFEEVETAEILFTDIRAFRDDCLAKAVLTRTRMGGSVTKEYEVRKSAREVFSASGVLGCARLEYPLPALPGKEWDTSPDRHRIASIDETIAVPAGKFRGCLRVNTYLAGGDAGSAIRYYAPGVGYVYEEVSGETAGARVCLVSIQLPKPH